MNWGFEIDPSKRIVIILIFAIYSLLILYLAFRVNKQNKNLSSTDKLSEFLTGGGKVSPFGIGMLAMTSVFSIGVMVGNVGNVYSGGGLFACVLFYVTVWGVFYMQGTLGKKMSILKNRAGINTILQAIRIRYNSKFLASFLALSMTVFLLSNMSSQYTGGARMFAVLCGIEEYWVSVLILGIITIIYSSVGGVKSMVRVAIVQGVAMAVAAFSTFIFGLSAVEKQLGSWDAAIKLIIETNPNFISASNYTFLAALGLCLIVSFSCTSCIHALPSTLTHNDSKSIKHAILLATLGTLIINLCMPSIGYFAKLLNPNLPSGDLATPFIAGTTAPSAVAGIMLAGAASALQSSCGAFMMVAATCLIKDFYSMVKPDASEEKIAKLMPLFTTICGVIGILLGLYPIKLMSVVNFFSNGGMVSGLFATLVFGMHWKKATPAAAIASSISGIATYIACYILSKNAATAAAWSSLTGGSNPIMWGAIVAIVVMIVVSQFTKKVEFGIAELFFGKTYDKDWEKLLK